MPGIDDMAFHVPKIYLPIKELAEKRNLDYEKLNKGLGLHAMSLADVHEDAATMAANAVKNLIQKNRLSPRSVGRIYVGSESATDGAKPIASYVLAMLNEYLEKEYGENALLHTDVVDMTFACIAGVDAMLNTLDWIRADNSRIGIVVCTDNAKYELGSTGEYTQGAGAVAMLLKSNPRLIDFDSPVGVATVGEHDFFKPLRRIGQRDLAETMLGELNGNFKPFSIPGVISKEEDYIEVHKIFPVFDGPYSNECYANRMQEAYGHFKAQKSDHALEDWHRIVFHLPYAFHGKRVFTDIFYAAHEQSPELKRQLLELDPDLTQRGNNKLISKTPVYKRFVKERIEKGQRASSLIGNLYTGSIFMSLMSLLESELAEDNKLENTTIGFCSYGSGSKSKVFEGKVQSEWKSVVNDFRLFQVLSNRDTIDFETYEKLHKGQLEESILSPENEFYLDAITLSGKLYGKRTYGHGEKVFLAI